MIDQGPPVPLPPRPPMVEQSYVKKDYGEVKSFKTEQEAEEYRKANGGMVIKQSDTWWAVIYIPKKEK